MPIAILLYSYHHNNTRKLVKAVQNTHNSIDIFDVTKDKPDLSGYDRIGIASGVYAFHLGKPMLKFLKENLPAGKETFIIYTYGIPKDGYTDSTKQILKEKNCTLLGEYGCLGFDTFGPFKMVGGLAKGHPDEADVKACVEFVEDMIGRNIS